MTLSLASRADRFPARTAVVDVSEEKLYAPAETIDEKAVTYAELSRAADRTAARLAKLGIGAGDTVSFLSRNRVATLSAFFACRRLGATFAPISHWLTPATIERPVEVLEPDLVVAERAQSDLVGSIPTEETVMLDEFVDSAPDDLEFDGTETDASDPLLALHGDGGQPVVTFSERTLEWNCISTLVAWGISRNDVAPLVSPLFSTDGLVRTALPLLYVGGELLLDRAFDPGDTLTALGERDATLLVGRARSLRDLGADSRFGEALASVDRLVCEGEIPDGVFEAARKSSTSILRAYGRLECPTAFCWAGDESEDAGVGRPMPDCRARLTDDGTVLEGPVEGRLELSGRLVAEGYASVTGGDEPATPDTGDETAARGRFSNGWLETEASFRRDKRGNYRPAPSG
ncbi:AMP-binding protein [Natronobacterium texcoconense]|uniref:AMP-binding protein n=1 Tax=Natronobacterium texcoconense TaxID=1095778 RepID=UPI000B84A1ED|nr:class I adenylate-forming enzyme family protein [Natronobacterium texcoconense]